MKAAFVLLCAGLAWGAEVRSVVLPTGEQGFSVRCDNENINACFEKAGDVCHRGYDIKYQSTESGYEASSRTEFNNILFASASGESSARSTSTKGVLVTCNEPEVTAKERAQRMRDRDNARQREASSEKTRLLVGVGVAVLTVTGLIALAVASK